MQLPMYYVMTCMFIPSGDLDSKPSKQLRCLLVCRMFLPAFGTLIGAYECVVVPLSRTDWRIDNRRCEWHIARGIVRTGLIPLRLGVAVDVLE